MTKVRTGKVHSVNQFMKKVRTGQALSVIHDKGTYRTVSVLNLWQRNVPEKVHSVTQFMKNLRTGHSLSLTWFMTKVRTGQSRLRSDESASRQDWLRLLRCVVQFAAAVSVVRKYRRAQSNMAVRCSHAKMWPSSIVLRRSKQNVVNVVNAQWQFLSISKIIGARPSNTNCCSLLNSQWKYHCFKWQCRSWMETEHDNGILLLKKSVWYLCSGRHLHDLC